MVRADFAPDVWGVDEEGPNLQSVRSGFISGRLGPLSDVVQCRPTDVVDGTERLMCGVECRQSDDGEVGRRQR